MSSLIVKRECRCHHQTGLTQQTLLSSGTEIKLELNLNIPTEFQLNTSVSKVTLTSYDNVTKTLVKFTGLITDG